MAQLTITVPDAQLQRVLDAFKAQYSYQATVPGPTPEDPPVPNPETVAQFVRRRLRVYVMDVVRAHESLKAAETARAAAANAVDSELALS